MALATPNAVVLELMTMGQQSAAHLGELLLAASPATLPGEQLQNQALAAEILRCCDRVIAAMSRRHPGAADADAAAAANKKRKATDVPGFASAAGAPLPSRRARGGAEARGEVVESGTTDDGFAWRKYGQKDINGCKHPRLYYRCAYRGEGCVATRRVQRSRDEPAAYAIAYYGEHTCGQGDGASAFQQRAAGTAASLLPAPAVVVGFGSNASGAGDVDRDRGSALPLDPAGSGASRRGWSSSPSSSSSEVELGASPSPVMEFLEGSFDWESVVNSLGFGDLPLVAMLQ